MVITDKEFADKVHILFHSLRLIPKYNPSEAEKKIGAWVIEKYSPVCDECKQRGEEIKNQPAKQSFLKKVGGILENA